MVSLSCQQRLAHLNQLLGQSEELSGTWLALTVIMVVKVLDKISKGDKANTVSVGLCQGGVRAAFSGLGGGHNC